MAKPCDETSPPISPGRSEVFLSRRLSAAHRILIEGVLEPAHGHDFRVTAGFLSEREPSEFAPVLEALLAPLACTALEAVVATSGEHASAERLARYLASALREQGLCVSRVSVEEAPGCRATYLVESIC